MRLEDLFGAVEGEFHLTERREGKVDGSILSGDGKSGAGISLRS